MRIRALGIVAVAALLATPVFAADMPLKALPPPVLFSWTGFYGGVNLGYSWGNSSNTWNVFNPDINGGTLCPAPGGLGSALCLSGNDSSHMNGVLGGVQAGYNWQTGNYLFGLEADIDGTGQRGSQTLNIATPTIIFVNPGTMSASYTEKLPWFGTLRGRLGFVNDRTLVYATGGLAYGEVDNSGSAVITGANAGLPGVPACSATLPAFGTCPLANWNSSSIQVGWALGAGIEQAFFGNWSLKAEYLHVDLGRIHTTFATSGGCFGGPGGACASESAGSGTISSKITDDIVRVGVNYRFGHP